MQYTGYELLWLFLGSLIYAVSLEWIAGHLIEKYYHERWWDYSGSRWNLDRMIEKLPVIFGKISTWVLIVFMCCNIVVSCMTLVRYGERQEGIAAEKGWQVWIDEHFEDARVERIYPNAIMVE